MSGSGKSKRHRIRQLRRKRVSGHAISDGRSWTGWAPAAKTWFWKLSKWRQASFNSTDDRVHGLRARPQIAALRKLRHPCILGGFAPKRSKWMILTNMLAEMVEPLEDTRYAHLPRATICFCAALMRNSRIRSELIFATELVISALGLAIPTSSSSGSKSASVELDEIEVRIPLNPYFLQALTSTIDPERYPSTNEGFGIPTYIGKGGAFKLEARVSRLEFFCGSLTFAGSILVLISSSFLGSCRAIGRSAGWATRFLSLGQTGTLPLGNSLHTTTIYLLISRGLSTTWVGLPILLP